ncbi:MAG: hypothetical protein WDZ85_01445 [Candidatus Paceibacterota bacterium]
MLIKEQAADFFNRQSNRQSLITVTDCTMDKNGRQATIWLTVLPPIHADRALDFAKRSRRDLKEYIAGKIKRRNIPHLDVELAERYNDETAETVKQPSD